MTDSMRSDFNWNINFNKSIATIETLSRPSYHFAWSASNPNVRCPNVGGFCVASAPTICLAIIPFPSVPLPFIPDATSVWSQSIAKPNHQTRRNIVFAYNIYAVAGAVIGCSTPNHAGKPHKVIDVLADLTLCEWRGNTRLSTIKWKSIPRVVSYGEIMKFIVVVGFAVHRNISSLWARALGHGRRVRVMYCTARHATDLGTCIILRITWCQDQCRWTQKKKSASAKDLGRGVYI